MIVYEDCRRGEFCVFIMIGSPTIDTRTDTLLPSTTLFLYPTPEFLDNGYLVARHLDDKAGVAAMLAAARAIREADVKLPMDCHLIFTIAEEVGVGASTVLHGDVAELVSIDNGTIAPGQYTSEFGVTIAMQDSSGPFDRPLTRSLLDI